jgi:hypothetical protein
MRLLNYNILKGGEGREAEIVEVIRAAAPDIVVMPEVRGVDRFRRIAAALRMNPRLAEGRGAYRYGLAYLVGYRFWTSIRFICGPCGRVACRQLSSLRTGTP